eukprot:TRINITY_DN1597_c0_g1_i1.p1 TRINITY_DN1597_c0_g1~~TRINITY_DN1597_c0_g1_i1.p1  ORF type:complete len:688 (-),score=192.59 TRINITY_DN1597_c0_g1_i1:164-2140(-)
MSSTATELHTAVELKDQKKVRKLLTKKKARQQLMTFDADGQTPLNLAIKHNDVELVDIILSGFKQNKADINVKDKNGYTALHQAVAVSDDRVLMMLLQYDGIDVDVENDDKNRPLHYFCQKFKSPNCHEPFQLFIEKGANTNAQNNNGETPLHKAIFNNTVRLMMVNLLLQSGADVNILNSMGETSLHYAVRLGRDDLVSVLLKAGADVTIVGNREKKTPYELAIESGSKEMAARIKKHRELLDWLQEVGMEQYNGVFVREEMFLDVITELDDKVLDRMGISSAGHRLKLTKAVKLLKEKHAHDVSLRSSSSTTGGSMSSSVSSTSGLSAEDSAELAAAGELTDVVGLRDSLLQMKHAAPAAVMVNEEIEFTEKLGAGSSGKVYKGLYKGKEVAVKVLKSMTETKEIEEFKKEFHIMSAIRSPHVVYFYGAVLEPKLCMVMEYCSKGSLFHVINDPNITMGWDRFFQFAIQTVEGINVLHSWDPQIVHRDLKSLNLLVNDRWEVKVCDFGLSRFNTASNLESLVKMRGTFAYCAPEVYFGEQFSTKSDIYSIGMILWELLVRTMTGRYERPFAEFKNLHFDFQIIIQTAKKGLRPTIPSSTPVALSDLIKECFDHNTATRPACPEIIARLRTLEKDWRAHPEVWEKAKVAAGAPSEDS